MRDQFSDFYTLQNNRYSYPRPFVALPKEQWNDTLNNFRIPLGEYDYRRMLFAKKFLYTQDEFSEMYKFVVVRNPWDRAVSVWKYVTRNKFTDLKYMRMRYSFKYFLSALPDYMDQRYKQIYHLAYIGLHAAPVWPDVTDEDGRLLVDRIVKLENFNEDMKPISDLVGREIKLKRHYNRTRRRSDYRTYYNSETKRLVDHIYKQDIENLGYEY